MQRLESMVSNSLNTLMQNKYERQDGEKSNLFLSLISFFDGEILTIKRQSQGHLRT
jgi:hypothetical protein